MKVAMVGDSHWDQHKRFDECNRLHSWIADDAARRGVQLTLHGGDVFERKSTALEREHAFAWFQRMADLGPVVCVRGNHDELGNLSLMAKLDTVFPITVVEDAAVVEVGRALVACLAWPRKSALLAATGVESHESGEALASEALRNVLRGLGDELRAHDGPTMVLTHAMLRDSMTSTGQPLCGCDLEVTLADLALCPADAYFAAHIHMHQHWLIGGAPVIYPGSPRRTAFGEREAKGYVVAEWDDGGKLVSWDFIEAPATPMVAVDDEWAADPENGGAFGWLAGAHGLPRSCAGVELRFRYRVASDQRASARSAAEKWRAEWLAEGAITVQIEEVVRVEQRTRADAIPVKATLTEKVQAYWAAKRFEPGERREALLTKLQQIEVARHEVAS